jgi:hypothetical protein
MTKQDGHEKKAQGALHLQQEYLTLLMSGNKHRGEPI